MHLFILLNLVWTVYAASSKTDDILGIRVKLASSYVKGGLFQGTVSVANIAYEKSVQVIVSSSSGQFDDGSFAINAKYASYIPFTKQEVWKFAYGLDQAEQRKFFVRYTVNGSTFYDGSPSTAYTISKIPDDLPGCQTWNGLDSCQGDQRTYADNFVHSRFFQTPYRGSSDWNASYQDYAQLTGFADITYNADRTKARVTIKAFSQPTNLTILYSFHYAPWTRQNYIEVDTSFTGHMHVIAYTPDRPAALEMEPIYFNWDTPQINRPETENGQKGAIVELWGWPYTEIEKECNMISKAGYLGVKIWPPNEAIYSTKWYAGLDSQFNPWYFDYQPVSYKIGNTRHGTLEELKSMIDTCRAAGVRIYADVVANHMTGGGNDILNHRQGQTNSCGTWGGKSSVAGSPYFTFSNTYQYNPNTRQRPALEFPAVPYTQKDFHCDRPWTHDAVGIQYGWLLGLTDLNTGSPYVQDRITAYLMNLWSLGFSGFRMDAAKHMGPNDLVAIFKLLKSKFGGSFPPDFLTWLEVTVDTGEEDLVACKPGDYNFYDSMDAKLSTAGLSSSDISKIKIWSYDFPNNFPLCGRWILPSERFVIQNDDHDVTAGTSGRPVGGDKGSILERDRDVNKHRYFQTKLFTRTDGNWKIRTILSGFTIGQTADGKPSLGYPDGFSECSLYNGDAQYKSFCRGVKKVSAYESKSCGYDVFNDQGKWNPGTWTRTHRDFKVILAMRTWMGLSTNVSPENVGLPSYCT